MDRRKHTVPEISADTIRQMDERNRGDISDLKKGQENINQTLLDFHGTLSRIDERLKDQKDIEDRVAAIETDVNQAKGVGKVAGILLTLSEVGHWIFNGIHR